MKRAALALALAALFAGCGDDEPAADGSTTQAGSTTASAPTTTSTSTQPETTTATVTAPTEDAPTGAPDPIAAATAVLTSEGTPAEACDRYVTPQFIETAYGGRENCIASRTGNALAQGLSLGTAIEAGATHLVVIPQGGPYDGSKVEVDLVRDSDGFRVDSLEAHVPAGP